MPFSVQCYQNNFLINNLNILSFGDCFGSIIGCMAFALLIELSRGIDLYIRHYSIVELNQRTNLSQKMIKRRKFLLHCLRTLIHLVQTALSYILMLMIMNDFVGFLLSAIIALGIGYYLLNGVHPYTRSANRRSISNLHSDLTHPSNALNENYESRQTMLTINQHQLEI